MRHHPPAVQRWGVASEVLFFVIAFGFSWAIWLPVAAGGGAISTLDQLAVGVAAAGPSLAGVLCTAREDGRSGVRPLFRSRLQWRTAARWYVLSLGGPLVLALAAVGLHRMVAGPDARFRLEVSTVVLIPPALVADLLLGSLQEELGWRGFALPRLLRRWGSVRAALALGVAWAGWHVPLSSPPRSPSPSQAPLVVTSPASAAAPRNSLARAGPEPQRAYHVRRHRVRFLYDTPRALVGDG